MTDTIETRCFRPSDIPGRPPIPVPAHHADALLDLTEADGRPLTAWHMRLFLASMGWQSGVEIGGQGWGDGKYGCSAWFKHANWQGTLCEVRLGRSVPLGERPWTQLDEATSLAAGAIRRAFEAARRAMTWTTSVPYEMPDGSFVTNTMEQRHFEAFPGSVTGRMVVRPERALPTELLPGWPGLPAMADFIAGDEDDDAWLRQAILLGRSGIAWRDDFSCFGIKESGWRFEKRNWVFSSKVFLHRWQGRRTDTFRALQCNTGDWSARGAADLAADVRRRAEAMRIAYPSADTLPPGCVPARQPVDAPLPPPATRANPWMATAAPIPEPFPLKASFAADRLSSWHLRLLLATRGWGTECHLKPSDGAWELSVYASKEPWQGSTEGAVLGLTRDIGSLDGEQASLLCRDLFLQLWNATSEAERQFPDSVPTLGCDGRLTRANRSALRAPISVTEYTAEDGQMVKRGGPTEDLPGWPGAADLASFITTDTVPERDWFAGVLDLVRAGMPWEDKLDPDGAGGSFRCGIRRRWTYRYDVEQTHCGEAVSPRLWRSTADLTAAGAVAMPASVLPTWQRDEAAPGCPDGPEPYGSRP